MKGLPRHTQLTILKEHIYLYQVVRNQYELKFKLGSPSQAIYRNFIILKLHILSLAAVSISMQKIITQVDFKIVHHQRIMFNIYYINPHIWFWLPTSLSPCTVCLLKSGVCVCVCACACVCLFHSPFLLAQFIFYKNDFYVISTLFHPLPPNGASELYLKNACFSILNLCLSELLPRTFFYLLILDTIPLHSPKRVKPGTVTCRLLQEALSRDRNQSVMSYSAL